MISSIFGFIFKNHYSKKMLYQDLTGILWYKTDNSSNKKSDKRVKIMDKEGGAIEESIRSDAYLIKGKSRLDVKAGQNIY